MKIDFIKYSGHGNDFILVDKRHFDHDFTVEQTIKICDRRFGIGGDGIILIDDPKDKKLSFAMRIYNCDGSEAQMCGNAARIAVANENMLTQKTHFVFETSNSIYEGEFKDSESIIKMSELCDIDKYDVSDLAILGGMFLNTGVPHTVIEVKNIEMFDLQVEGAKIRYDERFDGGTNVCFFEVVKKNEIKFRVFERGIEGETHCCGTGIIATAITCKELFNWTGEVLVHCLGGEVYANVDSKLENLYYSGKVDECFRGILEL